MTLAPSEPLRYTRRSFLKVVSAGSAGLLIGIDCASHSRAATDLFTPNVWIEITPDGVTTITVARSEMGQGVRTSLPMIVADELDADWSKVTMVQAPADTSKYGRQNTGGSSSVRSSYLPLRKAAASAREMLVSAAAGRWNVAPASCTTQDGIVRHTPTGRTFAYGDLAKEAAGLPLPGDPPLKTPSQFRLIGKKTPRLDIPDKVAGKALFGIDMKVPGMLHAAIARPKTFGAKAVRFDAAKALAVEGVREVKQVGDVVAVFADSTWAAFNGRDALLVTWEEGVFRRQSSDAIWKMFEEEASKEGIHDLRTGDPQAALRTAAKRLEAVYRAPFAAHAPMEPMNCIADVRAGRCEIWAPTQTPQDALEEVSSLLDLPPEKILIHVTLIGGGFGRRLETDYVLEAVKLSKAAGAPVKVVWTREDDMRHGFYRPATYNVLNGGLDARGKPAAWMQTIVGPSARGLVGGGSHPVYDIPNVGVDVHIVETGVPIGPWRSVGYSQNTFVTESFIDEMAHAAGADPLDYRRALLANSPRLLGVLNLAAEKAGWGRKFPPGRGLGVAVVQGFGSYVAHVAEVSVDGPSGRLGIERIVCAVDCGPAINPDTIEAQIEGAAAFALSAAMKDEITIAGGAVANGSFDDYDLIRMNEMPKVEVHIVQGADTPGGIGEPGVPGVAPAVCNAIFAAAGRRLRTLPFHAADLKSG